MSDTNASLRRRIEELQTQIGEAYTNGRRDASAENRAEADALRSVLADVRDEHSRALKQVDDLKVALWIARDTAFNQQVQAVAKKQEEKTQPSREWADEAYSALIALKMLLEERISATRPSTPAEAKWIGEASRLIDVAKVFRSPCGIQANEGGAS